MPHTPDTTPDTPADDPSATSSAATNPPVQQLLVPPAHQALEVDSPTTDSPTHTTGVPDALLAKGDGFAPLMIELDAASWADGLDRTKAMLDTAVMVHTSFRELTEDTIPRLNERHLKQYITNVLEAARRHEAELDKVYPVIGRELPASRKTLGVLDAKAREAAGALLALGGAATGRFGRLHMLFLASLNAIGAVAAVQQLGLALGVREINEILFPVINEKWLFHRLLQEVALEGVPQAVLYGIEI